MAPRTPGQALSKDRTGPSGVTPAEFAEAAAQAAEDGQPLLSDAALEAVLNAFTIPETRYLSAGWVATRVMARLDLEDAAALQAAQEAEAAQRHPAGTETLPPAA